MTEKKTVEKAAVHNREKIKASAPTNKTKGKNPLTDNQKGKGETVRSLPGSSIVPEKTGGTFR